MTPLTLVMQQSTFTMYTLKAAIIAIIVLSVSSSYAQHIGINVDDPSAQLHIQHVRDTSVYTTIDFEDQSNPLPTFSSWTISDDDAPEGDYYLSSLPWDFAEAFEWNLTDSIPQGQKLYISYYMRYDLAATDLLVVGSRAIDGPATSAWQLYTDTLYSSNSFSASALFLSGNVASHVDFDSITIFQDPNEGKTLRLDDGYQQEGWILTTDAHGNAKWSHGGQTSAVQYLLYDQNKLALHPATNTLDIKHLSLDDAVLELKSNRSLWWKRNGINTTGEYSLNLSESGTALGSHSATIGKSTHATGSYALAYGQSVTAEGDHSLAGGSHIVAKSYGEVALGQYPQIQNTPTTDSWVPDDYLLVLGNGTTAADSSNALTVLKSGEVGIGNIIPDNHQLAIKHGTSEGLQIMLDSTGTYWHYSVADNGDLLMGQNGTYIFIYDANSGAFYNYSDPKLKQNMLALPSALSTLSTLPLYIYQYDGKSETSVGVNAQELAKRYPDLVKKQRRDATDEEYLAVNYQGLNIYAIKALQELSEKHTKLEQTVLELKNDIRQLKAMMDRQ